MTDLHVEEFGKGPPLLLIQGLGQSSWVSRFHRDGLAGRRVIVFDNRGTGRSFKPAGPYSIELLADDAATVLDGLGVERADVLGHSMGGYIAQTLALRRPELVRSLVLVGTGAGVPTHEPNPSATLDVWLANAGRPPEEYARATMPLSFAVGWAEAHPERYEEFVAARLEHPTPPECWRAQYDAATEWVLRGSPVEEISTPTLVIHGDADRVVPLPNGEGIARRVPGAELAILRGIGHYVMLERPGELNELAKNFLSSVDLNVPEGDTAGV